MIKYPKATMEYCNFHFHFGALLITDLGYCQPFVKMFF